MTERLERTGGGKRVETGILPISLLSVKQPRFWDSIAGRLVPSVGVSVSC